MIIALIGLGRWGQVLLRELKEQVDVKYACDSTSDLNIVFNDAEIEAVFIATPTSTHLEIARRALSSGKHVFLEKPGTTSSEALESLVILAREKGLRIAVGYEFPHAPAAKKLKELIGGSEIESVFFEWRKWGTFRDDAVPHLLSHEISIGRFLGLTMEPISCKRTRVISTSDILITEFGGNIRSMINRVSLFKEKTVTIVTKAQSYVWAGNNLSIINPETKELESVEIGSESPVAQEIADFVSAIEEKRDPLMSGEFALEVYRIIERV